MKACAVVMVTIGFCVASCGNLNSVHRTLDTSNGQGVLIDIKQRAILAAKSEDRFVVCAEPSPDSLSAYAFDLAAEGSFPGKSLGATLGSAESAAFVGLRSQSIQLLRDQFFRACEAYMNQAISAADYNLLIRRYQKQTAALLAIEQLTSVVTAPAAVVSAAGNAQGSTIAFLSGLHKENQTKVKSLEKDRDASGLADEKKQKIQAEIDQLNKQNSEIVDSMSKALPAKVATSTSGTLAPPTTPTPTEIQAVASTVESIVKQITQTDDFIQLCIIWLGNDDGRLSGLKLPNGAPFVPTSSGMRDACVTRIRIDNQRLELINAAAEAAIKIASNDNKSTPADRAKRIKDAADSLNDSGLGVKSVDPRIIEK